MNADTRRFILGYVVLAPSGEACRWTQSRTPGRAILKLLEGIADLWPYALENGYRCIQFHVLRHPRYRTDRNSELGTRNPERFLG